MNYIQQINLFWEKADDSRLLKGTYISMYFALLRINNKYGWREWFGADWAEVCQYSKVSKTTFYKGIEVLQKEGFILFEKGERSHLKPRFSILIFENKKGTEREQEENRKGTEREQKGNLDKLLNKETNKQENKGAPYSDDFIQLWETLGCHGNKQKAWKAWDRLTKVDKVNALVGSERYANWLKAKGDFKTSFQKHTQTYLNKDNKYWLDELPQLANEQTVPANKSLSKYYYKVNGAPHKHDNEKLFMMHKANFPNHIEIIRS